MSDVARAALPDRIVVGANGAYWRDFGDGYSMCPVSEDNDPIDIIAVYVLVPAVPVDAERPAHEPGESHQYRITCEVCGERGTIRLSVDPETWLR